ncbi:MAG TPA: septal ring lytic transglycosylase RlpA family protein [Rhizomicrobium sp.]|nr:septal ring lytic transglycosylase RlpA family protein [Rhizomicrobium sp.]
MHWLRLSVLVLLAGLAACGSQPPPVPSKPPASIQPPALTPPPPPAAAAQQQPPTLPPSSPAAGPFFTQTGLASFYGRAHAGKLTASGGRFDHHNFTAAHRSLAFGTRVRVTNLANGRTVTVEITDRGPHGKGRVIDVSLAAAQALDMQQRGITRVRLEAFRADQG